MQASSCLYVWGCGARVQGGERREVVAEASLGDRLIWTRLSPPR